MALAPSASFDLTFDDISKAAWARVKAEGETGDDLRTSRREVQLLLQRWSNRKLNLWQVQQRQYALTAGAAQLTMDADVIDVCREDAHVRYLGIDYPLSRISRTEYGDIPAKTTAARPTQFYLDRQRAAPVLNLYPVPDLGTYTLFAYVLRKPRDVLLASQNVEAPSRFLPALVSGLAYYLSLVFPPATPALRQTLKAEYEQDWAEAAAADEDNAAIVMTIDAGYLRG